MDPKKEIAKLIYKTAKEAFRSGLLRKPKFSEVPYPVVMETNLVIEYYSR